jgi:opacity protein-like surface antigen
MMKELLIASLMVLISTNTFAESKNSYAGVEAGYMNVKVDGGGSDGSGLGRVFGGYNFNESVGIELGAYRMATYEYRSSVINANVDNWGIDYSLLLRPSKSSGLNGLFVRAGGHWSDTSIDACAFSCASANQSGSGFLAGAGYDAKFNDTMSARIAYTYRDSLSSLEADGHTGTAGILYHF